MAKATQEIPQIKIVVVGDGAVGKTCLLLSYTKNIFPEEYIPTVFDNYSEQKKVHLTHPKPHEQTVRLDLWDTAGQEEFDRIRPLSYRDANFFLVCFAVDNMDSFEHVVEKWVPEITHHAPGKGFLLIGLKSDLRKEGDRNIVPIDKIMATVHEIEAETYVECSALKLININTVFDTAMKRYLNPQRAQKKRDSKCLLM